MLEEIKADAARLGQKDATKDDHFLQVVIMFIDSVISVTVGLGQKNTITVPQLVKHITVFFEAKFTVAMFCLLCMLI